MRIFQLLKARVLQILMPEIHFKTLLMVSFLFLSPIIFAQSMIGVSTGAITGFNTEAVYLWKYQVEERPSVGGYIFVGYKYKFKKPIYIRTGLGFMQYYGEAKINKSTVKGYSNNFILPIAAGYLFNEKWGVEAGVSFQDYRARNDFAFQKSYNLRTNMILGASYAFSPKWKVDLAYSLMISKKIDSFAITHRANHIMLGVSYSLFVFKSKSNK